jgi:hypothetical protein
MFVFLNTRSSCRIRNISNCIYPIIGIYLLQIVASKNQSQRRSIVKVISAIIIIESVPTMIDTLQLIDFLHRLKANVER